MATKKETKSQAKSNHLDFLFDLYTQGAPVTKSDVALLRDAGYFQSGYQEKPDELEELIEGTDPTFHIRTKANTRADSFLNIITEGSPDAKHILGYAGFGLKSESDRIEFDGKRDSSITKEDWAPDSLTNHTKEFVDFIDSLLFYGFQNRTVLRKLSLYARQAKMWIEENDSVSNYETFDEKEAYKDREIERCDENSLYFLNKYLMLKQAAIDSGARQYESSPAHEIICYLFDCGYSFLMGKPRQIAATTTIGGLAIKKLVFNKNFFIKFITQDKKKGEEIFEDKIKYASSELPDWLRPEVKNDSLNLLAYGDRTAKKGTRDGVNSKLEVLAPTGTAVSGGSPDILMVDEIGNIGVLSKIIEDFRPTMFWVNPKTKKMEIKRQICGWGTGGETDKGGKAFEREFMSLVKLWKARNFSHGIVPLFFDWRSRIGVSQKIYDDERAVAYSKEGPDAEDSKVQFHQTYPETMEEMFLTSSKTLVSQEYINENLKRIQQAKALYKAKYGRFEPIYGDKPTDEGSDVPFNIIGATFVALEPGDLRRSCMIFQEPKPNWKKRYFQGTDPIASDSGQSNMASAIWDKHYNTVSAVVDYRTPNYKDVFLQTMLLGIYYDVEGKKGVKELLETNIGLAYRQYKETKGYYSSLVLNTELPQYLQVGSGSNAVGIDNRGNRNGLIVDKIFEIFQGYGVKIYIEEMFIQARTFVNVPTIKGNDSWGPSDRRYYKDDILFAIAFSYICSLSFPRDIPTETDIKKRKMVTKYVGQYDKNFKMHQVAIRVPAK